MPKYDYNIVSIFNINGHTGKFNEVIESLGLSNKRSDEKFIPSIYLYASINDRVQLLQGLIDTDGNCTGSAYDYYTTSSCFSEKPNSNNSSDTLAIISRFAEVKTDVFPNVLKCPSVLVVHMITIPHLQNWQMM